jgi:hypothetical protein
MKTSFKAFAITLLALVAIVSTTAMAHHSHAMFDHEKEVELSGDVYRFLFSNPHSMLYLNLVNEEGDTELWSVEMGPIAIIMNNGITRNTYQTGDKIALTVYPLRNGEPGGSLVTTHSVIRDGVETLVAPLED